MANDTISIDQFITFTPGGPKIAEGYQIKDALIKRYKEVYGTDIDVSNTTADGVFINDLTLIINNILRSFQILYQNLDVNTATGVYLDNLCRLSNVSRKSATASRAYLNITALDDTTIIPGQNGTVFVDTDGNNWIYNGNSIDLAKGESTIIQVICSEKGPIEANPNSQTHVNVINQTLTTSYLEVSQTKAADVGSYDESDTDLRARRAKSNGSQGITVEESLIGALLDIPGIKDAQIINNNKSEPETVLDGTKLTSHSVYIIIRRENNIDTPNNLIGSTIYNAITPGINTNQFIGGDSGESQSYTQTISNISSITNTVYWKSAIGIAPNFMVTVIKGQKYNETTNTAIGNSILEYLNNLSLSEIPVATDMIIQASYADSSSQYVVTSATGDIFTENSNPNTFYDASKYTYTVSEENSIITFIFTKKTV